MSVSLRAVSFFDPSRPGGASWLRIRQNLTLDVPLPEWQRTQNGVIIQGPSACSIADAWNQRLTIGVQLERLDARVELVEVRALDAGPLASPLGPIRSQVVTFPKGNISTVFACELDQARPEALGVANFLQTWIWQYRTSSTEAWRTLGTTVHNVYIVLTGPKRPWVRTPLDTDNAAIVWADVLEFACAWAAGALTELTAAAQITRRVFAQGPILLQYGCPIGAREMYANTPLNFFNCTAYLERLRGGPGNGPFVNCSDCASIVSTFANALGCDLAQSRMGMYSPAFLTNPILAIGGSRFESPCGLGLGFSFHEVAWSGQGGVNDLVYDACLAVDAIPNPWLPGLTAWVPVEIPFGLPNQGLYRDQLAAPGSRLICRDRPAETRRRIVI